MAGSGEKRSVRVKETDTLVIGGSQSGLAVSYFLTRANHSHVVLDWRRIGSSWIANRWDSFTLVTPNWMNRLPGFPYQGYNPDGFLARAEIVQYLEAYADSFNAPIVLGSRRDPGVSDRQRLSGADHGRGHPCARWSFAPDISTSRSCPPVLTASIARSRRYTPAATGIRTDSRPAAHIAEELFRAGRRTVLAVSTAPREPL
jgi:putative flavoprotein involved in K+ transport